MVQDFIFQGKQERRNAITNDQVHRRFDLASEFAILQVLSTGMSLGSPHWPNADVTAGGRNRAPYRLRATHDNYRRV